eukprot:CAMPEP_0115562624 /NCGR_PEP_ID=MMETSP0271-20121206/101616_1 /TAXON_ID=71861 /ORGANISM="Scrippsiella trochoidea, Strain CCMP3099" /LENGTH=71 /DNA_ID=CAMNT_0002996809 /DNA_START=156 /DNA_END=368 /DNA_ORIENTATION=+
MAWLGAILVAMLVPTLPIAVSETKGDAFTSPGVMREPGAEVHRPPRRTSNAAAGAKGNDRIFTRLGAILAA